MVRSLVVCWLLILSSLLPSCEKEEDPCFKCAYEERKTTGCNSGNYGAWTAGESIEDANNIKSGLSKQAYCDLVYPSSDSECAAGCCVSFQFRNVSVRSCN